MTTPEFNTHVALLRPLLLKVGTDFFRNEEEAEDVAQEALMRLWLLHESLPSESEALRALAVRIAKNVSISQWRRKKLRTFKPLADTPQPQSEEQADSSLMEREDKQLLAEAIRQLSPSERRLFLLKQEPEMDIGQMALLTGMKPRSVSAVLSVARRKLYAYITKINR